MAQIKRCHPDSAQLESDRKEREEICKIIIAAYEQLKKEQEGAHGSQDEVGLEDENEVAWELFNKPYNSIKHTLYLSGNEKRRADFVQKLE